MNEVILIAGGTPITLLQAGGAAAGLALLLLIIVAISTLRAGRARAVEAGAAAERQYEIDGKMAALQEANAQLTGRIGAMAEGLGTRQSDLARFVSERLDAVGSKVGQSLEASRTSTTDNLTRLNERLAVIDAAQQRLAGMTQEVIGLKDILANKQQRGAFGQGRMEAIVRDGLPSSAYDFQFTLASGVRPDCVIRLPGDTAVMAIDAKFPLEAFTALKAASDDEGRKLAAARVRSDFNVHIKAISERYIVPGETQDIAVLFVPAESIYADLNEHFDDVVQKAHRARIIIVSPSLLMMAIQVMQSIVRDARMREQAHLIQKEVRHLVADITRLKERVGKLDTHFRQAQGDISEITVSTEKIGRRGDALDTLDFGEAPAAAEALPTPGVRLVKP